MYMKARNMLLFFSCRARIAHANLNASHFSLLMVLKSKMIWRKALSVLMMTVKDGSGHAVLIKETGEAGAHVV